MKKYIINKRTCILIKKDKDTLVIEDNKTFYVEKNIRSIINDSCKYYGANYKGRIEAANEFLNTKYKNPIIINANNSLILFPTSSIRNDDVMFINYKKIVKYEIYYNLGKIFLINDIVVTTKISNYTLNEQLVKCILLNNLLNRRNN